jgi:hypothetical protein
LVQRLFNKDSKKPAEKGIMLSKTRESREQKEREPPQPGDKYIF